MCTQRTSNRRNKEAVVKRSLNLRSEEVLRDTKSFYASFLSAPYVSQQIMNLSVSQLFVYKKNSFSNILKFHCDQSKPLQPLVLCIAEINWLHKAIHKSQKSFIMCYAEKAIDSLFWKMSDAPILIVKY